MAEESTGGDQSVIPEPEANFRELRESLIKLGEAEPSLICQTTKDGKPEVIIIPGRDVKEVEGSRGPVNETNTTMAISDDEMRILHVIPPHYPGRDENNKITNINLPVSRYFRPDENGKTMTEEEISTNISRGGTGRGYIRERSYTTEILKALLQALFNRNEANRDSIVKGLGVEDRQPTYKRELSRELTAEETQRFEALKVAFDPASYTPGEDLATRFNALVQKLTSK